MARQISAEEYQELGRNFYKLKQYDKALETFTKGIENCPRPTINLYDYRAATYDKLKRFSDAVKDGREMIRLNKTDVKGYLRTGSVLEKMGKEETALGIYKYGMKNISAKDKNFQLLQQLHNKLTRKLSPAASIDPFSVLPKELAEMVLGYLPFRQIVSCMRVSKGWHTYLSRLPKLWMHLDLRGARKPVPRSFVNSAFKYSDLRMTSVTLHRFEHMDVVRNLAKAAKGLTELDIISVPHAVSASLVDIAKNSPNLKKLVVHPDITEDAAEQILTARPELEHVAFHALLHTMHSINWTKTLPHLHTLSLSWVESKNESHLELGKLLGRTPSLRSLSLCNLSTSWFLRHNWAADENKLAPLTKLILKRVVYDADFPLPATLQYLVIENTGSTLTVFPHDPLHSDSPLSDLTYMSLSGFSINPLKMNWLLDSYFPNNGASKCAQNGKPLQHLSLRCLLDHDATLFRGPDNVLCQSPRILTPALESLDLGTMPCTDDDVEHLLRFDTGLTDINLSDTNITGASVKMLVDGLPKLRHLRVDNCTRISGRDALDYAERKGVSVSYQMGEKKGARRVRYG